MRGTIESGRGRRAGRAWRVILAAGLVAGLLAGSSALAQDSPRGRHREAGSRDPQGRPPRELMGALRFWRMAEKLQLTEKQIPDAMARVMSMERARQQYHEARRQTLEGLSRVLEQDKRSEGELRQALAKLRDQEEAFRRDQLRARDELLQSLTLEQQARFCLFEEDFPRDMHRLVERLREREPGARGLRARDGTGPYHPQGLPPIPPEQPPEEP